MKHGRKIAVIGLGYVGLPVAVSFSRSGAAVVGFDVEARRIAELREGKDRTNEVEASELSQKSLVLTNDPGEMSSCDFYIVTVPTPIDEARRPDLSAMLSASRTVGSVLKKGNTVVYESTVYPGAVEEDCVPVLQEVSGLEAGADFADRSGSIRETSSTGSRPSRKSYQPRTSRRSTLSPTSMDQSCQPAFVARLPSALQRPPR